MCATLYVLLESTFTHTHKIHTYARARTHTDTHTHTRTDLTTGRINLSAQINNFLHLGHAQTHFQSFYSIFVANEKVLPGNTDRQIVQVTSLWVRLHGTRN